MMKVLVIGLGQDGRLMSEKLLEKGIPFRVLIRRSSNSVDLAEKSGIPIEYIVSCSAVTAEILENIWQQFEFTNIYNFAANSFVRDSCDYFKDYIEANSGITWELLKFLRREPKIWMMHPLSSEILSDTPLDDEDIGRCIEPRNAYGLAKLVDLHSCAIERQVAGLRLLTPIIYNHESRFRPPQFFTRKLLNYLQDGASRADELRIYNCASVRDWGSAPEYMDMLLAAGNSDRVGCPLLGTGFRMNVEQFVDYALKALSFSVDKSSKDGLLHWTGAGIRIVEDSQDSVDANRVVIANRQMVEDFFGYAPKIFGANLVNKLAYNEI
jgi:GDPmannose 4,6-dehydratase